MQVRLAFSTAIQIRPEILLLDEVLAVGDLEFQKKCLGVLEKYKSEGITIIFVSHSMDVVRKHCNRVMLLNQGNILEIGETRDVFDTDLGLKK